MVSGSLSPRYSRYFSPFLHSTGSLSVSQKYLALPDGAGKFKRGVSDPALLRILPLHNIVRLRGSHPLRRRFPTDLDFTIGFSLRTGTAAPEHANPTTPHTQPLPGITRARFSLLRFRSPLLSESQLFSLPVGTEMFHFPTFPPTP